MSSSKMFLSLLASAMGTVIFAFQSPNVVRNPKTSLGMVAVDPTVVTNKEYEDICGTSFDDKMLMNRLEATNYLYPKHVEVIEDIAPVAAAMVDEVVSAFRCLMCTILDASLIFISESSGITVVDLFLLSLLSRVSLHNAHSANNLFSVVLAPRDRRKCLATSRLPS
jgi:hypothetical protein